MKRIFIFFSLLFLSIVGFGQLLPEPNADSLIAGNNVKSSSSYYHDSDQRHLIQKLDFDDKGNLINEFHLYLWDVVSYSYTNNYKYDQKGKLLEVLRIQKILNIYPKDADYIESFGSAPVNEKIIMTYDSNERLIKKETFVFHSEKLTATDSANHTITYEYEGDQLVLEESTSPETRVFNYNYTIKYDYDSAGNQIRKIRKLGTKKPLRQETRLKYDSVGQLIEKYVLDSAAPHNNLHEKYEYNLEGQLSKLYEFSNEAHDFLLETTFQYDQNGQVISGDRDVVFEYLENGLIRSESWKDTKTNLEITFLTEYLYF